MTDKEKRIKYLQDILDSDIYWNMSDDTRYYLKMVEITLELNQLKRELKKWEMHILKLSLKN